MMSNFISKLIFTLFAIIFSFLAFSAPVFASGYPAVITKITDGDTVWIQTDRRRIKLRLLGIDTPEEYYSKKMLKDVRMCGTSYNRMKQLGLAATRHAKTMLYRGENVSIETFGRGYYSRTLAFVILSDGINYNEQEVADGYACVYKYHGHKSRELSEVEFDKLNRLMEQAKTDRKGLWGNDPQVMGCLCGDGATPVLYKRQPYQTETGKQEKNKAIKRPTAICKDGTYSYSLHHRGSC